MLCFYSLFTICINPKVPVHFRAAADSGDTPSQTDPGKLATLCLLSGDVGSLWSLPRCHHHHCQPDEACGGPEPLEESFLPGDAKVEQTAGPHFRVSSYFKKGCSVHVTVPHFFFLFFFLVGFVSDFLFCFASFPE